MAIQIDMDKLQLYVQREQFGLWGLRGSERYVKFREHIDGLSNMELLELLNCSGCLVDEAQASDG